MLKGQKAKKNLAPPLRLPPCPPLAPPFLAIPSLGPPSPNFKVKGQKGFKCKVVPAIKH